MEDTKKIYDEFLEYFDVREIVSSGAYEKYKHLGNYFFLSRFDIRLISTIIFIRSTLDKPMTINDYLFGRGRGQRGLRDTSTKMMKQRANNDDPWLSAHPLGMAVDFDVKGMTANEVRDWIFENRDALPYKIRLERKYRGSYITWNHIDLCDDPKNPKVYFFDVN